jgi:hypothetical protein
MYPFKLHTLDDDAYLDIIRVLETLILFNADSPYDLNLMAILYERKNIPITKVNNEDVMLGVSFKTRALASPPFIYGALTKNYIGEETIRAVDRLFTLANTYDEMTAHTTLPPFPMFLKRLSGYMDYSGIYCVGQLLALFLVGRPVRTEWKVVLEASDVQTVRDAKKHVLNVLLPRKLVLHIPTKQGNSKAEFSFLSETGELEIATFIDMLNGAKIPRPIRGKELHNEMVKNEIAMSCPKFLMNKKIRIMDNKNVKKIEGLVKQYLGDKTRGYDKTPKLHRAVKFPAFIQFKPDGAYYSKSRRGKMVKLEEVVNEVSEHVLRKKVNRPCVSKNRTEMYAVLQKHNVTNINEILEFIEIIKLRKLCAAYSSESSARQTFLSKCSKGIDIDKYIRFTNAYEDDIASSIHLKWKDLTVDLVTAYRESTSDSFLNNKDLITLSIDTLEVIIKHDTEVGRYIVDGKIIADPL